MYTQKIKKVSKFHFKLVSIIVNIMTEILQQITLCLELVKLFLEITKILQLQNSAVATVLWKLSLLLGRNSTHLGQYSSC